MNRSEFIDQLEKLLQEIPSTEREAALQYYNDYFDDAGAENEGQVAEALGDPARVAEAIRRDLQDSGDVRTKASDRALAEGKKAGGGRQERPDEDMYDKRYPVMEGDVSRQFLGREITGLRLELGGALFETAASSDGSFYLTTENVRKYQCYVSEGVLCLKAVSSHMFEFRGNDRQITLYIPQGQYFEQVDIELGAGRVKADGLRAGTVNMNVGAGEILAGKIAADVCNVNVGAGRVRLPKMDMGSFNAKVGMGELVGSGSVRKSAGLECAMGNMELALAGSQKDFNYRLAVALGHLHLGKSSFSGLAQELELWNEASKSMDIDCAMGNMTVRFMEQSSQVP